MNMNRLINIGLRMLVNKGVEVAANRGKQPKDMTPQERAAAQKAQHSARGARRSIGMLRRFMR